MSDQIFQSFISEFGYTYLASLTQGYRGIKFYNFCKAEGLDEDEIPSVEVFEAMWEGYDVAA